MRFLLAIALFSSLPAFADQANDLDNSFHNSELEMNENLNKLFTIYPDNKKQLQAAHAAFLNHSKADCEFLTAIKKNNLSRTHMNDCMTERFADRANLYTMIAINKKR